MPSFIHHPSSYRDPAGFMFYHNHQLYRQVNLCFKEDFDEFISGGLYKDLTEKGLLVPHKEVEGNLTGSPEWHRTIQPRPIDLISYPYEWCFEMLKDAALLTIEIAKQAMQKGMMLKDASAYNVQWYRGKMIFIDTLSFERYDEKKPWIAYKQFCEHFFAPLALMHYLQIPVQPLCMAYPEGIPLSIARKLLPFRSRLNLHSYLHLHLHASVSKKDREEKKTGAFSKQKMQNLLRSLEEGIRSFSFDRPSGVWSGYYEEASRREEYIHHKKQLVDKWLHELQWTTALDAGANEGTFSCLVKDKAGFMISSDADHFSINNLYKKLKKDQITNICPIIMDLSLPSPAIGVNNKERSSFFERLNVDLVMALALIHHLTIGKNIPFLHVAELFSRCGKNLLIEFVPKNDEKVVLMLHQKKDIYVDYNEQEFINAFEKYFTIAAKQPISGSGRILYLMKAHET